MRVIYNRKKQSVMICSLTVYSALSPSKITCSSTTRCAENYLRNFHSSKQPSLKTIFSAVSFKNNLSLARLSTIISEIHLRRAGLVLSFSYSFMSRISAFALSFLSILSCCSNFVVFLFCFPPHFYLFIFH